jgi:hypothetical protein
MKRERGGEREQKEKGGGERETGGRRMQAGILAQERKKVEGEREGRGKKGGGEGTFSQRHPQ